MRHRDLSLALISITREGERHLGARIGFARAGDAQGKRLGRAALAAAGLQNDFMNHKRRAVFVTGTAIVGRIAAQRVNPLGIGTAESA